MDHDGRTKSERSKLHLVEAEVTVGERTIIFRGPEAFVKDMISKYAMDPILDSSKHQVKSSTTPYLPPDPITRSGMSEKELIQSKRPHGHPEIVAVLAFGLTESGISEFSEDDIRRAYIRAGVRPPKVVAQALRDAKNKFEFVEPTGTRGVYRLTNHGDRVVRFDLPRQGANTDE